MTDLLQRTIDGICDGSAYALVGLGLALSFGIVKRLNLAYGATAMLAAYIGAWLYSAHSAPIWLVAMVIVAATIVIGGYVEWLCFSHNSSDLNIQRGTVPVAGRDGREVVALASSFALWMQLEQLAIHILPRHLNSFPSLAFREEWAVGALVLRPDRLALLLLALVLTFALHHYLQRSKIGLAWRASADQRVAAHLTGIRVERMYGLAFALASALSGIAAFAILSLDGQVTPMFGMWVLLKGLTAAMLGGIGSVRGVFFGGLLLGIFEAHVQALLGPLWREFAVYLLLFIALVFPWRPFGLKQSFA
jgi:branched-chain amino acid transport system permease protein